MTARRSYSADDHEPLASDQLRDLPMFVTEIRTLARPGDPDTSKQAALAISDRLTELQQQVYQTFVAAGPMTAKECEDLPEYETWGFSTVRKRCSELLARGWLVRTGVKRGGCDEYTVKDRVA
jgi:hypothetical protein